MKRKIQNLLLYFAPVFVVGIVTVFILITYWGRCGSLLIDTFRDPIVAWKITSGQCLYRDIFYEYGLLPPYFLALLIKVFGLQVNTFMAIGAAVFIAMVLLVYAGARKFLNRWLAILPAIIFAAIFGIKQYYPEDVFNYLFPYSFASIFFSLAGLAALLAFLSAVEKPGFRMWLIWAACMYVSFLCRAEMSLLIWGGFFLLATDKKEKILFLPPLAAVVTYVIFLFSTQSFNSFYTSNIAHVVAAFTDNAYFTHLSGGLALGIDFLLAIQVFCTQVLCVVALAVACQVYAAGIKGKVLGIFLVVFSGWLALNNMQAIDFYRSIIFVLASGIFLAVRRRKANNADKMAMKEIILYSMGIVFAARILFSTTAVGLSFCFLPVAVLGFYVFFFGAVTRELEKKFTKIRIKIFLFLMTALFFSVHLPCLCLSWSWLHERNLWVETPRGRFYCFFSRSTIYFWQTVIYLESNTSALATVAVVPEGLGINFFSLRQNLFKYTTTLSSALDMVGDENMIEALKKSRPDYIVVTSRDSSEYGKARFGIDYAQKMNAWIMRNYVLEKTFGPYPFTAPESGIAIWRNRENSVKSF